MCTNMQQIDTKWSDPYRQGVFEKDAYTKAHAKAITTQHNENVKFYFVLAGVVMLLTTPFFSNFIPFPVIFVIIGLLIFALLGSIADMESRVTSLLALIVAAVCFAVFEFMAIMAYPHMSTEDWHVNTWFVVNQLLALNFFFAIHGSARYLFVDYINRRDSKYFV